MKKLKTFLLTLCLFMPLCFAGCENIGKKTLSTPSNLTIEANGIISFDMVEDAEYYTIMIDNISVNVFPNADENNKIQRVNNTLIYDASKIFVVGESYDVKVIAKADKKSSSFTNIVSYTHAINIDKATNLTFNGTVLSWDSVEHANFYTVKVITPNDNITNDSPNSVASSDLIEYRFSTNRFDFSSLITSAGEYKFYINAVSLENNRLESGYTNKAVYVNNINLKTPINSGVYKITEYDAKTQTMVDNFHLLTIVDDYTNAINLKVNEYNATAYIDGSYTNIKYNEEYANSNVIDINLSGLFANSIDGGLNSFTNFDVSAQAIYKTSTDRNFYTNSAYTSLISVQNLGEIARPNVSLSKEQNSTNYQLSWEVENTENISGFAIYLATSTGVEIISVDANTSSFVMPAEFISASVQAIGKGNYISSKLSNQATVLTNKLNASINCGVDNNYLSWNVVSDAKYIAELDNKVYLLDNSDEVLGKIRLDIKDRTKAIEHFAITIIKGNYAPLKFEFDESSIKKQLSSPFGLTFSTDSLYVLNFYGSENAIGYYVYLNNTKIQKLFTSTTINLSNYLTGGAEYTVKVEAVADKYSIFSNSEKSVGKSIMHQQNLSTPTFGEQPVIKTTEDNVDKYTLKFNGVAGASSYEVLVNYNSIACTGYGVGEHELDITSLILGAGKYTIMVRALPSVDSTTTKPSSYGVAEFEIKKQLESVKNVKVTENQGKYTLSFETQENAEEYRVRIIKVGDSGYENYLANLQTPLPNPFTVYGSCNISDYVVNGGKYLIYVTAVAGENSYYIDSDETNSFTELNKLTTLDLPTDLSYSDTSNTEYYVKWLGDEHADYFVVNVVDPNNIEHEFTVLNVTSNQVSVNDVIYIKCNINSSISIQGLYRVKIKAMVDGTSVNSFAYTNSAYCNSDEFIYQIATNTSFARAKVSMYGKTYNYSISDVEELKNVLWYNYLYEIDSQYQLRIKIETQEGVSINDTLKAYGENYSFNQDADWLEVVACDENGVIQRQPYEILTVLCSKLLNMYPELHALTDLKVNTMSGTSDKFKIYYKNALNGEKVDKTGEDYNSFANDYVLHYDYLDSVARRSSGSAFAIDSNSKVMYVTTTEQLLHAVQYGYRPVFVGDSSTAETVYKNAKSVLLSIINGNMNDLEKADAIFNWLNYAINLNFKSTYYTDKDTVANGLTDASKFGNRSDYYLESVFLNIKTIAEGGWDGEFYLGNKAGTSDSYSKAFTLLCAIEGIETRKINAYFSSEENEEISTRHSYNIVNIDGSWYAVDLMFSDLSSLDLIYAKSTGSHRFFMVNYESLSSFNDLYHTTNNIKITTNTNDPNLDLYACDKTYEYLKNSTLRIKSNEVRDFVNAVNSNDLNYSKQYNKEESYHQYNFTQYKEDSIHMFIINNFVYAYNSMFQNNVDKITIEFNYKSTHYSKPVIDINTILQNFNNQIKDKVEKDGETIYLKDLQLDSTIIEMHKDYTGQFDENDDPVTVDTYTYILTLRLS